MIGALAAAALALAAPAPPQVAVSARPGSQAETTIAASPTDPAVLLAASNTARGDTFGTLAYTSTDAGATWTTSEPFPSDGKSCAIGDPVVAIDDTGRELAGYLTTPCADSEFEAKISLYVSTRVGPAEPWTPVLVADPAAGSNDKPALAWDVSPASPHHGRAYLAWNRIVRNRLALMLSHSDDGGATWSAPAPLAPAAGGGAFFVGLAVAPTGELYADWVDGVRQIQVARSADGGDSFGPAVFAGGTAGLPSLNCRLNGIGIPAQSHRCVTPSPSIVAGPDKVVVAYAAAGSNGAQLDVRVIAFDLALQPLGRAVRAHPADGKVAADQFQPVLALDAHSGLLWLCFYDTRGDRTRRTVRFVCTASRDGQTWVVPATAASVRSNETRRPASGFQFGDYQGLAVGADGVAHPIWTDSRALARLGEEIYTTALAPALLGFG